MLIKILREGIITPSKGSIFSAGIDIYSPIDFQLYQSSTKQILLGIAIEINKDEVAIISERSSMGKKGITSVGNIIDSDYRGEISIFLQNNNLLEQTFKKGDRIGQIIVCKLGDNSIRVVNSLSKTDRGESGIGSTDI